MAMIDQLAQRVNNTVKQSQDNRSVLTKVADFFTDDDLDKTKYLGEVSKAREDIWKSQIMPKLKAAKANDATVSQAYRTWSKQVDDWSNSNGFKLRQGQSINQQRQQNMVQKLADADKSSSTSDKVAAKAKVAKVATGAAVKSIPVGGIRAVGSITQYVADAGETDRNSKRQKVANYVKRAGDEAKASNIAYQDIEQNGSKVSKVGLMAGEQVAPLVLTGGVAGATTKGALALGAGVKGAAAAGIGASTAVSYTQNYGDVRQGVEDEFRNATANQLATSKDPNTRTTFNSHYTKYLKKGLSQPDAAEQARLDTISDVAESYAEDYGKLVTALEPISAGAGKFAVKAAGGVAPNLVGKLATRAEQRALGQAVRGQTSKVAAATAMTKSATSAIGRSAAEEGLQEGLTDWASQKAAIDNGIKDKNDWGQTKEAAVYGAILGGLFGGGANIATGQTGYQQAKSQLSQIQQTQATTNAQLNTLQQQHSQLSQVANPTPEQKQQIQAIESNIRELETVKSDNETNAQRLNIPEPVLNKHVETPYSSTLNPQQAQTDNADNPAAPDTNATAQTASPTDITTNPSASPVNTGANPENPSANGGFDVNQYLDLDANSLEQAWVNHQKEMADNATITDGTDQMSVQDAIEHANNTIAEENTTPQVQGGISGVVARNQQRESQTILDNEMADWQAKKQQLQAERDAKLTQEMNTPDEPAIKLMDVNDGEHFDTTVIGLNGEPFRLANAWDSAIPAKAKQQAITTVFGGRLPQKLASASWGELHPQAQKKLHTWFTQELNNRRSEREQLAMPQLGMRTVNPQPVNELPSGNEPINLGFGNNQALTIPDMPVKQQSSNILANSAPSGDLFSQNSQDSQASIAAPKDVSIGADGQPKWFGSSAKAQAFIDKNNIGHTHQVMQTDNKRFEILPKAEQAQTDINTTTDQQVGNQDNTTDKVSDVEKLIGIATKLGKYNQKNTDIILKSDGKPFPTLDALERAIKNRKLDVADYDFVSEGKQFIGVKKGSEASRLVKSEEDIPTPDYDTKVAANEKQANTQKAVIDEMQKSGRLEIVGLDNKPKAETPTSSNDLPIKNVGDTITAKNGATWKIEKINYTNKGGISSVGLTLLTFKDGSINPNENPNIGTFTMDEFNQIFGGDFVLTPKNRKFKVAGYDVISDGARPNTNTKTTDAKKAVLDEMQKNGHLEIVGLGDTKGKTETQTQQRPVKGVGDELIHKNNGSTVVIEAINYTPEGGIESIKVRTIKDGKGNPVKPRSGTVGLGDAIKIYGKDFDYTPMPTAQGKTDTQADNAAKQRPSQSQGDGAGVGTNESAKPSDEQVKTALKELVSDDVWSGKKALIISPSFAQKVAEQLSYQGDIQNKADGTMSDFAKQVNDVYGGMIKNQAKPSDQKVKDTPQPSKTEVYADKLEKWVANTKSAAEFSRSVTSLRDSQLPNGVNVDFYNFIAQAIGAKSPQTIGFRIKLEEYWLAANDTKNNNAQSTNKYEKFQSPIISDDIFENTQQQTNGAKEIKFESNKNYQFEYDVNAALDADGFNQEGDFLRLDYKNKNQPLSAAKAYGARVFFSYNQTTGKVSSIVSVYTDSTHKRSIEITNEPNNQYPKVKFETEFYKPLFDVVAKDERAFQDYIDSGKWQAEKDAKREQIKQNFIDNKPAIFTDLAKKYMSASLVDLAGVETAEQFRSLSDESQAEAFAKLVEQTGYVPPKKKSKPTNVKEGIAKIQAEKKAAKKDKEKFADNKVFTADKVAAARARMKSKLSQLNSGLDPELMMDGMTIAGAYIESGVRKFGDYASAMIEDFGGNIKPYLLSFWESARHFPGLDTDGMTSVEDSKKEFDALMAKSDNEAKTKQEQTNDNSLRGTPGRRADSTAPASEPSQGTLAGISTDNVSPVPKTGDTTGQAQPSSRASVSSDESARRSGAQSERSAGNRAATVHPTDTRSERVTPKPEQAVTADNTATDYPIAPPQSQDANQNNSQDFTISEDDEVGKGGLKTKFKQNLEAIKLLKQLQRENRQATKDEQKILTKWVGWGGLKAAFRRGDGSTVNGWAKEVEQLEAVLTPDELDAALNSTIAAHYTEPKIVKAMWKAVEKLGFNGGRVLEPSIGSGIFLGMLPASLRKSTAFYGTELDTITGGLAQQLYPTAAIKVMGFQDYSLQDGFFKVAIGNPPFANIKITDLERKHLSGLSLHNYFFAKSLDALEPNGVLAMVVTSRLLDGADPKTRNYLFANAELLMAVRLPNNAFKENANTDVTTDIIFLRKRTKNEREKGSDVGIMDDFDYRSVGTFTDKNGTAVPLNNYFIKNPDHMLGEFGNFGTMYARGENWIETALVAPKGQNTLELLNKVLDKLPTGVITKHNKSDTLIVESMVKNIPEVKVGSMFEQDGNIYERTPDSMGDRQAVAVELPSQKAVDRVTGLIGLRSILSDVRQMQLSSNTDETVLEQRRAELNKAYDQFVKEHGHINSDANKRLFKEDPSWSQLSALEDNYDKGISPAVSKNTGEPVKKPSAKKAAILERRTQYPFAEVTQVSSAKDGMIETLNSVGRLDLARISQLYGKNQYEVVKELGDLIYQDPVQGWVTADNYLSGNVKAKLAQAREAMATQGGELFERNVKALEQVQPQDIEAVDIEVRPGAHWIPANHITDFLKDVLGATGLQGVPTYSKFDNDWTLPKFIESAEAGTQFGTNRKSVRDIVTAAMNGKQVTVYDQIDRDTKVVNQEATNDANQKVEAVKRAWNDWIWMDDNRRDELAGLYNDIFNTDINQTYDGSHLKLLGKVDDNVIELRPTQKNAIWRITQNPTTLLDHVVGAGKTFTMVAAAMELRRMGLASKPMIVVPNHLVGQWGKEFIQLYPNANILVATKKDFEAANRKRLVARIANGDWDAVIVAHSSFGKIAVSPEFEAEFIKQQIQEITTAIEDAKKDAGKSSNARDLANRRLKLEEKYKKLTASENRDTDNLYWDELGVDALMLDEAHEFKNLAYTTSSMNRVAGLGNQSGSQKAMDLFMKIQQLKQNPSSRTVFATGTPISNSMAEMYTMQRYLDMDRMKNQGIAGFDAWAKTFGEVVNDWELSASGKYQMKSRFAKFVNMPELMQSYLGFADVINRDDINDSLKSQGKKLPVPKIKGGAPQNTVVERSDAQADFIGVPRIENGREIYGEHTLIYRAEHLPKGQDAKKKGADNMLKIIGEARKAALDMRILDPNAPDFAGSKVNKAVENIMRIWRDTAADKGTQLVFCDLSTPKGSNNKEQAKLNELVRLADEGNEDAISQLEKYTPDELDAIMNVNNFSVYDDMKQKLIAQGIPENEIAFIHDANTELQKDELFSKVRSGRIRVLLGSTSKMGAGTNVQTRLVALHHMDAPWRPSDLEQREGRIIRQGNELYAKDPENFEVEIHRYATEQTMDAMQWQIIENKAKFIEQVRKGDIKTRVIEDIEGEAANAGAMKAAASGNPLILEEMALKKQLNDLDSDKTRHDREQHRIKATIKRTKDGIDSLENEQSRYTTLSQAKTPTEFDITVNGKNYKQGQEGARTDAGKAIISQAIKASMSKEKLSVGQYGDFTISATANPTNRDSAILSLDYRGESIAMEVKHSDPAGGIITKLINRIKEIPDKLQQFKTDLEKSIKAIPKLESQLKPWGKEAELDDIRRKHTEVMDALKPKKEEQAQPTDKPQYSKRELLAPNGKPSNLTPEQYAQVRTPEFKAWFGDWENDPDNASKVIDKNGEPLVLYHGSPEAGFSEFNGGQNDSIHFTNDIEMAAQYSGVLDRAVINDNGNEAAGIYPVFLNAKNPLIVDWDHRDWNYAPELYYVNQGGKTTIQIIDDEDLFIEQNPDAEIINSRIGSIDELATMAQEEGYDAVLANNLASLGRYPELDFTPGINTNEYVVFESNQIKSATNNTGAFDPNNDDIRYSKNSKGATDTTPTQVRNTLVKQFGEKTIKALEDAGVLHIKQLSDFVDENGNLSIADDAEGFFHDGKAVLIADNIDANQIIPVFLHEVGGHAGLQNMLSPNAYANLMQTFNAMVARGDEIALRAKARAELASENQDQATTEYLPYLLSEISNAQAKTPFIKRLLDRFVGAVRAWVYAKTGVRMNLTHADILGLAELTINERARNIERTAKLIKQANKQYSQPATNQSISYSRRFAPIQQSPIPNKPAAKKAADWLNLQWATKWVSWDTFSRLIRRNIATPQHVAITHADYKKFWDLVQQRINYTNYEAANAVGLVPEILDKRLIIGQNKKDIEAVSKVIFDGTMNDVVYGDTELTRKGLTDKQIDLYRRVRQAIDESVEKMAIDVLANSAKGTGLISLDEILRIKEAVLANGGNIAMFNNAMQQAVNAKIQAMLQAGVIDATKAGKLTTMFNEVAKQMDDVENRVYDLQDKGYAPLMRFGSYAVAVNDSKGDLVLYELYETKREQQKALHDLKKNPDYAGMTFNQNVLNPGDYQQFTNKGLNPETVMLFANELGLSSDEANQAYLKVAIAQQSALKRLIHRKKVAGFSEDLPRVLSAFVMSNARHSSRMLYNSDIQKAQQAIKDGDLRGEAQNLFENMENPAEEFASFRAMMFHWNMGFSPAFGLLNMTQPFIQTIPQLTMYDGVIGAHKSVLNGIRKAMASQVLEDAKGLGIAKNAKDFVDTIPSYMRDDYIRMTKEGHLDPQNVWLLQGLERGKAGVASGALGMVGQAAGYISEATETINRRATMYAALEIARKLGAAKLKAKGFDSAYDFAVTTIQQTQGVYNKGNRSGLARSTGPASKFGAVIMMYKQFSINLIEQQIRMGQQKQAKALATAWVYQWLLAGAAGLIAADDLKDIIETIAFKFGYALNTDRKMQEFFIDTFGKEQGNDFYQMFNYGVLSSVSPIDFHGRSSAGNIIPATGLLHPSKAGDQKTEATEALGVGANWIGSMFDAGKLMMNGQFRDAMVTAAPRYVRDSVQAYEIATTGSMRDKNGRKVMDMTQGDAVAKALQFNPKSNAQRGREAMSNWQDKKLIENVKGDFTVKLAEAMASKDQAAQDKVMADIDKWNAKNDKQYQMDKTKITKSATDKAKKRDFTADERQTMPKSLEEYVNSLKKTG